MNEWQKQIFEQKSLWEVYSLSRREMPRVRKNVKIILLSAVFFGFMFVASLYKFHSNEQFSALFLFLAQISDVGFVLALSILGFLVAGFSIFASVTNPRLFIMLVH